MIKIYGTDFCSQCKLTKNYCVRNNIEHEYVDLEENPDMLDMFNSKGFRSLPIVTFNDEVISSGHDTNKIDEAIK